MAYAPTESNPQRMIGFVVVLLLHVGIFWALQSGLATSIVQVVKGPLQAELLKEPEKEEEPPPPPPPKLNQPPPPSVIMPEINIEAPAVASTNTITVQKPQPKVEAPPATVSPKKLARFDYQPAYPTASIRLEEQGVVTLLVTVDEDGKVTEATVHKSSGYQRLDEAAVAEAKRRWRFTPGTVGGRKAAIQITVPVRFNIEDVKGR